MAMYRKDARIVYMGTPEISAIVLRGLIEAGFQIVGLICNEDEPIGRKGLLEPVPTKRVALEHGIPVFQPHRIREDYAFLYDLKPDVIVTMAYGQIVPQAVLDIPVRGCINLHGSLLPKLRGAAPIQRSIMEGHKKTGVTLMQMVAAMDAGLMYDKEEVEIAPDETYTSLQNKISDAGKRLILRDLLPYLNGELPGVPQNEDEVTFAAKIKPEDEHIPLSLSADEFVRYAHGLSEEPGGYLLLKGEKLKIYLCKKISDEEKAPIGTIIEANKHFVFQAKGGAIEILSLQLQGKKKMDGRSFLNGAHGLEGEVLI
jgi:methionyl-tRNA formyltransferase